VIEGTIDFGVGVNSSDLAQVDYSSWLGISKKAANKFVLDCGTKTNSTFRCALVLEVTPKQTRLVSLTRRQIPIP
jgi:hypothetical protein